MTDTDTTTITSPVVMMNNASTTATSATTYINSSTTAANSISSSNSNTMESTSTSNSNSSGKTTPPRHNYHNTNTPIASIKRPRSSLLVNKNTTATSVAAAGSSSGYATPLRSNSGVSSSSNVNSASTPMSIVRTDRSKYGSSNNDNDNDGGGDDIVFASPLPASRSGRVFLPTSNGNNGGMALSLAETEALTLSPLHGVRPVTYRDVRDINNTSIAGASNCIRPLDLHDIEEGDDDDNHRNYRNSSDKNNTLQRHLSPSSSSTTSSPTNATDHHDNGSGGGGGGIPASSSWVNKKVDALFSPVYQFLNHEEQEQQQRLNNSFNNEKQHSYDYHDNNATPMVVVEKISNGGGDDTTDTDKMTGVIKSSRSSDTHQQTASTTATLSSSSNSKSSPASSSDATFDVNDDDDDIDIDIADNTDDDDLDHSNHRTNAHDCDDDDDDNNSMGRPAHPTDIDEFNPWQFIKSLPEYERIVHNAPSITLPAKASGAPDKTLVLDLDETLVHCTVEPPEVPADLTFPVVFHGITYTVHVKLRPFLHEFLELIKDKFEIIVFTASQKVYADELLNLIDPNGVYIHHRLFRESCLAVDGNFLKDLNVLGRDLSKTVLVDNSPHAFGYQVDNGIPIESWFDCPNDRELLKLERFLRTLLHVEDVRPTVRNKFQSYRLIDESCSTTATSNLYG